MMGHYMLILTAVLAVINLLFLWQYVTKQKPARIAVLIDVYLVCVFILIQLAALELEPSLLGLGKILTYLGALGGLAYFEGSKLFGKPSQAPESPKETEDWENEKKKDDR